MHAIAIPDSSARRIPPFALATALCAVFLMPTTLQADAAKSEPAARAVAERTLEAMGGADALAATRFLRFEFFGARLHHWDRHTGRHRLEGKSRDTGDAYVVVHNLNTREGQVWINGEEIDGEDKAKWLENAYGAWINDTYWLLMPYKLRDPGVTLTHAGEVERDGKTYDKLKLTFDGVGLTPGDTYFAWINQETGLMDRWAYHLQGWEADRAPTEWEWRDWQGYGGIQLSSARYNAENDRSAELGKIKVYDSLPDTVFEQAEMPALDH